MTSCQETSTETQNFDPAHDLDLGFSRSILKKPCILRINGSNWFETFVEINDKMNVKAVNADMGKNKSVSIFYFYFFLLSGEYPILLCSQPNVVHNSWCCKFYNFLYFHICSIIRYHSVINPIHQPMYEFTVPVQGSFCVCAQPIRDNVTL